MAQILSSSTLIVIPARLASTRLSEKLLHKVCGKSILQHTWEAASRAAITDRVIVAVDDSRLADDVESFGGAWVMTSVDCPSGTDRIAEVAEKFEDVDIFINVQGDEPEIDPRTIDRVGSLLHENSAADMATIGTPIRSLELLNDPGVVKIVLAGTELITENSGQGRAVYFSRSVVPFSRGGIDEALLQKSLPLYWHHLGLYAYRREFLKWFANEQPSVLEQAERLEQLRAIEAGKMIVVAPVKSAAPGIDTKEDLLAFERRTVA